MVGAQGLLCEGVKECVKTNQGDKMGWGGEVREGRRKRGED